MNILRVYVGKVISILVNLNYVHICSGTITSVRWSYGSLRYVIRRYVTLLDVTYVIRCYGSNGYELSKTLHWCERLINSIICTYIFSALKEVGHTFVVMVCILPIFNSLWHHFGIVTFWCLATQQSFIIETYLGKTFFPWKWLVLPKYWFFFMEFP